LAGGMKKLIRSFDKFDPSEIRNSVIQKFGQQSYAESIINITANLIKS